MWWELRKNCFFCDFERFCERGEVGFLGCGCMDGREAMAYYMQSRMGGGGSGSVSLGGGLHGPAGGMRPFGGGSLPVAGGSVGHGFSVSMDGSVPAHGASGSPAPGVPSGGDSGKKKRGRPRKYEADGSVSLALSPVSPQTPQSSVSGSSLKRRGRPPGSGKLQQLATQGEWMSSSAGLGFTPHVVTISVGEDISAKVMSFSQQGPRAVCVLTATGSVSTVTLRQSDSSVGNVTYEGRFEILSLSGSYLVSDNNGSRSRTGGLSVSLSGPDGRVIGGGIGGLLIAATPVQVIVGSFNYGRGKTKTHLNTGGELIEGESPAPENTPLINTGPANQRLPSQMMMGGLPSSRPAPIDIDLMRG